MNTSYFYSKLLKPGMNLISIAYLTPKINGLLIKQYTPLFPNKEWVRDYKSNKITIFQYTVKYMDLLFKLDPKKVVKDLGDDAILLCYEKPKKFCHRKLVAMWLESNLGIEVKEL